MNLPAGNPTRTGKRLVPLLAVVTGVLLGIGAFTFQYAEGLSYLSTDPKACVNCHIMRPQYDSWQKSSHHAVAACIDCHLPHDFIGKYLAKAENGYHHSRGFTFQDFHEPIMIKAKNAQILQDNCQACHADLAHEMLLGVAGGPDEVQCVHCHASIMPLYRELGGGDAMKGFEESYRYSYQDLNAKLHEMGHGHPVSCVDCHSPDTMELRVTRPGFVNGIRALANSDAPVPHLPSIERWRAGSRADPYDPNTNATRTEMRSYVCGQCHVEYYCAGKLPLTFPWGKGLRAGDLEAFWNETTFEDGSRFMDYRHTESGAPILKAQHPEFELWSQGIPARSGVACADCHMPYQRDGASKVSDHWVRSPLLNISRACQTCHRQAEDEIKARVDAIQQRNFELLQRSGEALMDLLDAVVAARKAGATDADLEQALELQRKAQWYLDFIAAENSMGFHAPQEAAKVLGEAADYARQGQVAALTWNQPK